MSTKPGAPPLDPELFAVTEELLARLWDPDRVVAKLRADYKIPRRRARRFIERVVEKWRDMADESVGDKLVRLEQMAYAQYREAMRQKPPHTGSALRAIEAIAKLNNIGASGITVQQVFSESGTLLGKDQLKARLAELEQRARDEDTKDGPAN